MVSRSFDCSSVATRPTSTPALVSVLRFVSGSPGVLANGYGWHVSSASDPPFAARARSTPDESANLDKQSIYVLVVEDNPADVSLLRQALNEHGVHMQIVVVNDGEKAMQFVDRSLGGTFSVPKLVVLDLNLPKRHGREVLQHIRAHTDWSTVPVAVLSSSAASRDRDDAARLGAARYIRKPLDLDEFIAIGDTLKGLISGGGSGS